VGILLQFVWLSGGGLLHPPRGSLEEEGEGGKEGGREGGRVDVRGGGGWLGLKGRGGGREGWRKGEYKHRLCGFVGS